MLKLLFYYSFAVFNLFGAMISIAMAIQFFTYTWLLLVVLNLIGVHHWLVALHTTLKGIKK